MMAVSLLALVQVLQSALVCGVSMRKSSGLAAVSLLLVTAPAVWADTLVQSPEVYFPNSAPRRDITVRQGDVLAKFPLLWASAARIDRSVDLALDGKTQSLAAGTLLPENRAAVSDGPRTGFCTPLRHGERSLEHGIGAMLLGGGSLWRDMAKRQTSGQFCLFDSDGDGKFDEARYFSSALPRGGALQKIVPIPFVRQVNVPVSSSGQDEVRLVVWGVSRHALTIRYDLVQAGQERRFSTIHVGKFELEQVENPGFALQRSNTTAGKKIDLESGLPLMAEILGSDLQIQSVAPDGKSAVVRFPEGVELDRVIKIPEETEINFCYGYSC